MSDEPTVAHVATFYPVQDDATIAKVIEAPVNVGDNDTFDYGRSEWHWFLLANGDLVMGCFPQSALYEELERTVGDDYDTARKLGLERQIVAEMQIVAEP